MRTNELRERLLSDRHFRRWYFGRLNRQRRRRHRSFKRMVEWVSLGWRDFTPAEARSALKAEATVREGGTRA